jgi:flagellar biosynthetic protein FliR
LTLGLPVSTLCAFLLVLARVAGLIVFLPIPGFRAAPDAVRVVLALALTLALFPAWPALPATLPSISQLMVWVLAESGFGLAIGLAVAFLIEGFQMAAQIIGLQAGYGYSLTVDPTSQVDTGVLQVFMMLITGILFFSTGLDRELMRILAASFVQYPAGSWAGIVRLGGGMLVTGLRLAFPVVALLLLVDLALALLGRMQQQLQLLTLAFPVKMLAALAILTALTPLLPKLFSTASERTFAALWKLVGN